VEDEVQGGRVEEVSRLREVSVSSLEEVVSPSTPGAVVLYTSPFCTHCTVASHVVHTVQRLLHPVHLLGIRFFTVDATRNDLPVQFTALSYPTVLVFPQHRKAESRVFPLAEELNTTNLLSFILSNLTPAARLRLALSSCSPSCLGKLRLRARDGLARLAARARTRPGLAGRRAFQRWLSYNKTVLYVVAAWEEEERRRSSEGGGGEEEQATSLPSVSEAFVAAILDTFREVTR